MFGGQMCQINWSKFQASCKTYLREGFSDLILDLHFYTLHTKYLLSTIIIWVNTSIVSLHAHDFLILHRISLRVMSSIRHTSVRCSLLVRNVDMEITVTSLMEHTRSENGHFIRSMSRPLKMTIRWRFYYWFLWYVMSLLFAIYNGQQCSKLTHTVHF